MTIASSNLIQVHCVVYFFHFFFSSLHMNFFLSLPLVNLVTCGYWCDLIIRFFIYIKCQHVFITCYGVFHFIFFSQQQINQFNVSR